MNGACRDVSCNVGFVCLIHVTPCGSHVVTFVVLPSFFVLQHPNIMADVSISVAAHEFHTLSCRNVCGQHRNVALFS